MDMNGWLKREDFLTTLKMTKAGPAWTCLAALIYTYKFTS